MQRVDIANLLGGVLALALAAYGGQISSGRGLPRAAKAPPPSLRVVPERGPSGRPSLRDADGFLIPLEPYQRIASATMVADRLLADLCSPTRIAAFSTYSVDHAYDKHRYAGKPTLPGRAPIETVLALKPDLLIVNNLVDPGYVARLREHGINVFDLGPMHGLATLLPSIARVGHLVGAAQRAETYARRLEQRLQRVHPGRPGPRPRALYLSLYGDRLYGGAAHTSYHDILHFAGFVDVAAQAGLEGWPELNAETVLALAPQVLVTKAGMGPSLCRHPGLENLAPCRGEGRIIALPAALVDNPGPTMLEATEALHEAYWSAR